MESFFQYFLSCIHFLLPRLRELQVDNVYLTRPLCGDAGIVFSKLLADTIIKKLNKKSKFYQATKQKKQLPSGSTS